MLYSFQRLELYYPAPLTHDRNFTMKSIEVKHTHKPHTKTFPQTFLILNYKT